MVRSEKKLDGAGRFVKDIRRAYFTPLQKLDGVAKASEPIMHLEKRDLCNFN